MTKDKIKPSEPKFKVGDEVFFYWTDSENYFDIRKGKICNVSKGYYEFSGGAENDFVKHLSYDIDTGGDGRDYRVPENCILTKEEAQAKFNEWIKS